MKKSVLGIIIAVVALGAIGAFVFANSSDDNSETTPQNTAQNTEEHDNSDGHNEEEPADGTDEDAPSTTSVAISNFAFSPASITVKKGSTVTWTNNDSQGHHITPDNPTDEFAQSDLLSKGQSYSVIFNTVGESTYFCTPHPFMKGSVTVTE